jgi:zinc protease
MQRQRFSFGALLRLWAFLFFAGLIAGLPSLDSGARAADGVFNAESFGLANGMTVIVVPQPRQTAVTQMVWYKVGAVDEPRGKSGMAHFLEHLMFKGTSAHAAGEFSQLVARGGGRDNAFTSSDYTAFFQTVAKDQLPLMMALEADRMTGLKFEPGQVEPERQVILEERHSRVDNEPEALMAEQLNAVQFLTYPYRNPVIGWEHDVRAVSVDDLRAFYERWYAPNNAILVVAGNVTTAEVKPLAEQYYGAIPAASLPQRVDGTEPPPIAARQIVVRDPRVSQAVWERSYLSPSYRFGETKHAYSLQVLAQILGGGPTSRLYRRLVVGDGTAPPLAVSAHAEYDPMNRGPSRFVVEASPKPGVDVARIEAVVDQELDAMRAGTIADDELERAKRRLQADSTYARDSLFASALIVGQAAVVGLPLDHVERWPQEIAAVTREQIADAARYVLSDPRSVTALLPARDETAAALQ